GWDRREARPPWRGPGRPRRRSSHRGRSRARRRMRTRWLGECSCLHSASCIDICRYVGQARPIEEHQYMEVEVNPVIVIGAGPQRLAAAAHLLERGLEPLVLESGDGPASAVSEWGHVRLFSPWSELIDPASRRLLEPTGWSAPETGYPTGAQW